MSLKAIKEALSLARARKGFGDTEEEMQADAAAQAQIAALEKAAKVVAKHGIHHVTPDNFETVKAAEEFLATIAKEAE